MAKYSRQSTTSAPSPQTQEEALKIAKATQRPGQTKEQTKLITQGIQKGIEQYKKQHKAKLREMDKRNKKSKAAAAIATEVESEAPAPSRQHPLPWILLLMSWFGFIAWMLFSN